MNDRSTNLKSIRPIIATALVNDNMSSDECFQNATIRPIVKMQNHLLVLVFRNYITKRKNVFYDLSLQKQLAYIENAIHKDMKFRNSIKGMIIGQFTVEEYELYIQNSSALNKRMMSIVKERLVRNIQVFAEPLAKAI
ncbi:glyoxalase [Psychroserpens ponticola]|uniref:Glyoxalase n=1 Tax=Psychroserpens ponticola TaxID=2932268 RepID=A0ABY7S2H1_9FLAO|nr:glyoxalase [Psychroserpens ponticola]WCO03200.1 glyoxalase [Psychroserpens ponticola]